MRSSSPDRAPGRVVVTGAAGMLGRSVVAAFAERSTVTPHRRADCDLADLEATLRWFEARKPDLVVHCAAFTDVDACESRPERAWRDNATAARHVALAAAAAGASLLHVSTDYVFDGQLARPYREDDAPAPLGVYGRSKRAGEEHVLRHAPHAWVARTSWLFGPGGRNFVRTIAGLLAEREEIRVVDDQRGSPTYTHDLAAAFVALVSSTPFGVYHVTNSGACTWFELASAIAARLESRCRVVPCTTEEYPRPAPRPRNSVLDATASRARGLAPLRGWQDALGDYLAVLAAESRA